MKHFYSVAQESSTKLVLQQYRQSTGIENIQILGSVYLPLVVFVRVRLMDIASDGGGGIVTHYVAIEYDGKIVRNANPSMDFENALQRLTVFSELIPINEP
jgi:hypothetical protein